MNIDIKNNYELVLSRLNDKSIEIRKSALNTLHKMIREAAGTITEEQINLFDIVEELKNISIKYEKRKEEENFKYLSDFISVLSVSGDKKSLISILKYRLLGGITPLEDWGHQYVKQLIKGCNEVRNGEIEIIDYTLLVEPIVKYLFKHNCEIEAIDFLIEINEMSNEVVGDLLNSETQNKSILTVNKLELISKFTEELNFNRVYDYIVEMSLFYSLDLLILELCKDKPTRYLIHLIRNREYLKSVEFVMSIDNLNMRKQCIYILARCNISIEGKLTSTSKEEGKLTSASKEEGKLTSASKEVGKSSLSKKTSLNKKSLSDEEIKILKNEHIFDFYIKTAEDLEILESKKIDYILKGINKQKADTAAVTNGLIHLGFSRDPVFMRVPGDFNIKSDLVSLISQTTKIGTIQSSVGLIFNYNQKLLMERFEPEIIEKKDLSFIFALSLATNRNPSNNLFILDLLTSSGNSEDKNSGVDKSSGLDNNLSGYLSESTDPEDIIKALFSLSISYSGMINLDKSAIFESIFPLLNHSSNDVVYMTIYLMGVLYMGNGSKYIDFLDLCIESFTNAISSSSPLTSSSLTSSPLTSSSSSSSEFYYLAILGIGLFFYKSPELATTKSFLALEEPLSSLALGFMNLGSGNALIIRKIMENIFLDEEYTVKEAIGLLSISLIALSDSTATDSFESLIGNCINLSSSPIKNVVPLCLGLLNSSKPTTSLIDYFERTINSKESDVSSMIALGMIGAGSNSARILKILNSHFNSFFKDDKTANALIFAQGLISLGKGMLTINPLAYSNNVLIEKSIVGLLTTIFLFIDEKQNFFKNNTFMLFSIAMAATPKYIVGIESEIKVGKPVETVGLTGNPNKISGVVIHKMPVLIDSAEKAEVVKKVCTEFIEDILVEDE